MKKNKIAKLEKKMTNLRMKNEDKKERWELKIEERDDGKVVYFKRFNQGKPIESYAPVYIDKAVIFATSIIQGYQPPRLLRRLDKPSD